MTDLLEIVEAAYARVGEHEAWLRGIATAMEPHLQQGWGISAWHMDSAGQMLARCRVGVSPDEQDDPYEHGRRITPQDSVVPMLRALREAGPITSLVTTLGEPTADNDPASIREVAHTRGAKDCVCVMADTLEDEYVGLGALRRERWTPTARERKLWGRLTAHIGAGLRLRRQTASGGVVASPSGRIEEAGGLADEPQALEAIRLAVRGSEKARGSLRRDDVEQALELWQALVSGRWSLVDHFDSDGRRYILARENAPNPSGHPQLTPRQRTAVKLRARGHSLKYISYELGLSVPTVSLELREAMRVLGVRSVLELGAIFSPANSATREAK